MFHEQGWRGVAMNSKTWIATGRNVPSHRRSVLATLIAGLGRMLRESAARTRQRRQLVTLSDHQLRDIGLIRMDVDMESRKPFWRA
jgi:uncharacterized protein YjiS (DUF1127 family)